MHYITVTYFKDFHVIDINNVNIHTDKKNVEKQISRDINRVKLQFQTVPK